jgi:hypothetical protein
MAFITRPDRDRWDRDPEYVANRAVIRAQRKPCARCGGAIAYDQPYWLTINGRRKVNPWAFHCGHVLSRHQGGSHTLNNLQAEHASCSISAGATESNQHKTPRVSVWPQLDTSSRW